MEHTSESSRKYTGRKIIHIDMDCFYAAVEIRDNPELKGKAVAVGGSADRRGVLCTCNYEARKYGVHSAMATSRALSLCKDLIVLPVNFTKYRAASKAIHSIFHQYTHKVEPLSLDEAFLDVTDCTMFSGSATLIAQDIRNKIYADQHITASAGIAGNKMLAKIASDWNKPNGQFAIKPEDVTEFMQSLPVKKLFGVGRVTAEKLHSMNIETCGDLQKLTLEDITHKFGKFGQHLFPMCRGIDEREVTTHRERKSLSTEETFSHDILPADVDMKTFKELYNELETRMNNQRDLKSRIKSIYVKIKFNDFNLTTIQESTSELDLQRFIRLFKTRAYEHNKPVRLIGFGIHFHTGEESSMKQLELEFP